MTIDRGAAGDAASLIPILAYEPTSKLFYGEDGTLGFGFLCEAIPGGDDKTEGRLRTLLEEDWPDETILQVSLLPSPNLVRQFDRIRGLRAADADRIILGALESRIGFFKAAVDHGFAESNGLHLRDFQVVISAKRPIAGLEPTTAEMELTAQLQSRVLSTLEHAGLRPEPLTHDLFVGLLNVCLNRSEAASWRTFGGDPAREDLPLSQQVFDRATDLRVDRGGLWLDDVRVSLLSAKTLPETLPFGLCAYLVGDMLHGARGLRGPFFMTLSLYYPPQQSEKLKLATKRQWVTNSALGPMAKWMPALAIKQRDLDAIGASIDNGHRPLRFALTLALFSHPEDATAPFEARLRSAQQRALADQSNAVTYWSESQFGLMRDRFICLPLFINALPFCGDRKAIRDLGRYRTCTTEHATRLLPVFADWRGTSQPVLNLVSRQGQLMNLCLFESSTNYNAVIAAESGSGKSFFANNLIESYLGMGGHVWTIDAGYSYQKLTEEFGGDFVDFHPDKEMSLNPFPLVVDYDDEGDVLEACVIAMAAPNEGLTDLQTAELRQCMRDLWVAQRQAMTIDLIAERLKAHADPRVRDVGVQLYQFTTAGAYGRYFHGPNTVSFRKRFTVLELDHLRSRKHLQQVVLLMLIYTIQQQMFRMPKDIRKILLIDEAWELLTDGALGRFIEFSYRRIRKYGGAAITITQSVADFHKSETGKAITSNSAWTFLLGQKSEVIDTLVAENKLALTPYAVEVLKSVHTLPGQYSEIFIKSENGQSVGRLLVPPFSRLLYSTRPDDLAAITRHKARGLSTVDAIHAVLAERRTSRTRRSPEHAA